MSKFQKKDSKNKKSKKIILNTAEDLLKISNEDFEKLNISNLYGVYYEQIYKEALEKEKKDREPNQKKKSKTNKEKPLKSILKNNYKEKIDKANSPSKLKEKIIVIKKPNYKAIANNFNNKEINTINNKHLFSPEIPPKKNIFEFNNSIKYNSHKIQENKNQFNLNQNNNINNDINNKKIEINLLSNFNKYRQEEPKKIKSANIEQKNYITDINEPIFEYNFHKNKSEEIEKNLKININNSYLINKILFYIRYDSKYGDNIGILGSIEQLGNWSQDKILYLKWNNGNIWKGEIDINNLNINKFEFKFINRNDGIIYWERGYNNVVDLKEISGEFKYHKKGRYNKYEYNYDNNNFELVLTCKIKGWE